VVFLKLVAFIFQYNVLWSYVVLFFSLFINGVVLFEYEYKGLDDETQRTIWEDDNVEPQRDDDEYGGRYVGGDKNFGEAFFSHEVKFTDQLKDTMWNDMRETNPWLGKLLATWSDDKDETVGLLMLLSLLHFIFCVLLLLSHIFGAGWLNMKLGFANEEAGGKVSLSKLWTKYLPHSDERFQPWTTQDDLDLLEGLGIQGGADAKKKKKKKRKKAEDKEWTITVPWWVRLFYYSVLLDIEMIYYLLLAAVAFCAFYFEEEIIVALSILDIVRMSPSMQKIMRSFTKNLSMVIFTLLFALILLFIFVAWSFRRDYAYSFEDHNACNDVHPAGHCGGSMWKRMLLHIDYGMINPLIGSQGNYEDDPHQWESWDAHVFGALYYFLINLVATAIISGIIIDTFAEMRSDRKEVMDDLSTSCFVCDIEVVDFEQANHRFEDHVTSEHNMWQYVWLKIYLRDTDPTDFKGLELHVAPLLLDYNKAARCMPIKRARAIQGNVKDKATLPTLLGKVNRLLADNRSQSKLAGELKHRVEVFYREQAGNVAADRENFKDKIEWLAQEVQESRGSEGR